ncbi:MAG: prolipoprotein diacylglyceryl transferase [Hyphomicrobiaceae bacterium]
MSFLALPYPAIDPVALQLGPFAVKWYGLAYVAGLLLGWQYLKSLLANDRLWAHGRAPLAVTTADDLFIWVALGVVLGGRLGHVFLYEPLFFLQYPGEIVKVWHGGMAFHGGLIGTIVAMWLFARRNGVSVLSCLDLVAASVPFGLFFGRLANFINAEVVGRESTVPWAMVFPGYGDNPRHPSQIYEAVLEGLVTFLILRWMTHKRGALAHPGLVGGAFLLCYGGFRFLCEFVKHDDYSTAADRFPVTLGALYCIPMVIVGLLLMRWARATPARA